MSRLLTRLSPFGADGTGSKRLQLISVVIQGQPDQYLILVATSLICCIDDKASDEVSYWKPEHGQPE